MLENGRDPWRQASTSPSRVARPLKRTCPLSARNPDRMETRVDLPAPLRPTNPRQRPERTATLTPRKARRGCRNSCRRQWPAPRHPPRPGWPIQGLDHDIALRDLWPYVLGPSGAGLGSPRCACPAWAPVVHPISCYPIYGLTRSYLQPPLANQGDQRQGGQVD